MGMSTGLLGNRCQMLKSGHQKLVGNTADVPGEALQLESFRGRSDVIWRASEEEGASPHQYPLRSLSVWLYSGLKLAYSTRKYICNEDSHRNQSNLKEEYKITEQIFIQSLKNIYGIFYFQPWEASQTMVTRSQERAVWLSSVSLCYNVFSSSSDGRSIHFVLAVSKIV